MGGAGIWGSIAEELIDFGFSSIPKGHDGD